MLGTTIKLSMLFSRSSSSWQMRDNFLLSVR